MKVLVTGGAGYIGSHVVKLLGESGHDILVIDNLSTGHKESILFGDLKVFDLSDIDLLEETFNNFKPEGVIHLAGSIVVPDSISNPVKYYFNNTVNSLNLIEMCLKHNVKNFIFSSTAAVYGITDSGIADEHTKTEPINPYGRSKLMVESFLKDISEANKDFNYVALRYFNVSGADPDGNIGQAFPGATHLIKVNCEAALNKRESVSIYGTDFDTVDGTGVRDFIHVCDLADAHLKALDYVNETKKSDIFNCGYSRGYSVKEVIKEVKSISKVNYKVIEMQRRTGDLACLIADSKKIRDLLKWKPKYDSLEVIVKTAFDWENSSILRDWQSND